MFAENLGLAFQICDDILDVEGNAEEMGKNTGHDTASEKATYPALHGIDKSKEQLHKLTDAAIEALADYYDNAELFVKLAKDMMTRIS